MARSSDVEGGKANARKRKLNLIYFVDSARTKSLSIPLGRLRILIALQLCLLAWTVGSLGTIVWLQLGKMELRQQLAESLETIFEYESRHDRVYEIAYPEQTQSTGSNIAETGASARLDTVPTAQPAAVGAVAATQPSVDRVIADVDNVTENAKKPLDEDSVAPADDQNQEAPRNNTPTNSATNAKQSITAPTQQRGVAVVAVPTAKPTVNASNNNEKPTTPGETKKNLEVLISITNPVIEPKLDELELKFDLTNRSAQARAEGFLWAVAEFQTADGRKVFLGAPSEIDVNASGEPRNLSRSASFGIKHFKKKSFSFPYAKHSPGIFTAIRIGVMDKTGTDRTTYHVPIEIRVPQGS